MPTIHLNRHLLSVNALLLLCPAVSRSMVLLPWRKQWSSSHQQHSRPRP